MESISELEMLEIVYDVLNARYCDKVRQIERMPRKTLKARHIAAEEWTKAEKLRWQKTEVLARMVNLQFKETR